MSTAVFAVETKLVIFRPRVVRPRRRYTQERTFFAPEQLQAFLRAADEDLRTSAMFRVAVNHGLRVSEIAALRWEHVDFERGTIRVQHVKGSRAVTQDLIPSEREKLLAWREVSRSLAGAESGFVFPSRKSTQTREEAAPFQLNRSQISRLYQTVCQRAGIERKFQHVHTLRHTFCMMLLDAGATVPEVAKAAGHKSIQSTMAYTLPSDATVSDRIRGVFGEL